MKEIFIVSVTFLLVPLFFAYMLGIYDEYFGPYKINWPIRTMLADFTAFLLVGILTVLGVISSWNIVYELIY